MLSKQLLDILACPQCKGDVHYDEKKNAVACEKCRLRFAVLEGGVPDMLLKDAEKY